ncbi:hydroxyacylglutathione hydrolase [Streptacidiphilus sp. MAP12-33]|uniref:MBL fold metallo-hydrolase n=1 Tax=Streptacidiphilus sp. MAP12-33 TaxID=3156266 RepID=UPI0035168BD4
MLTLSVASGMYRTNVHVLAEGPGAACVIVDPGHQAFQPVLDLVEKHRLTPEAVLLTHGHMDHTWDAAPLADHFGVPAWIHPADRYQLGAPAKGLPANWPQDELVDHPNREPAEVRALPEQEAELRLAGIGLTVLPSPGHTGGSVMFLAEGDRPVLLSGDTLLAGGPGRSDAPGGSSTALRRSLQQLAARVPAGTRLLPGHGPTAALAG